MISKIGSFMATIGLLAIVLNFLDMVPKLLAWIYLWGDAIAWVIMIAITVVGGILWFFGRSAATE